VTVEIAGHPVHLCAWHYTVQGVQGHLVPVYLLDTALQENTAWDRTITDHLYGGDQHYRLCQEAVLGMGGVALLQALGYGNVRTFHMNEGHSALLTLALLADVTRDRGLASATVQDITRVRERCVFTTHTPVPAGHDQFPRDLVRHVLGERVVAVLETHGCLQDGVLNMTHLALFFSRYINGVSMRHEQISRTMFPHYPINSITNGVHALTWTAAPFQELYDRYLAEWRRDNRYLRSAISIPLEDIQAAHARAKAALLQEVQQRTGQRLSPTVMTLGFARRATLYKRVDLLFADPQRLQRIARHVGPLQVLYGGKAHPRDEGGKALIRRIVQAGQDLREVIRVVYLEEYDMFLGTLLCSGVDLWLNTPQNPQEASGTSGMKAALNGVPSCSVLDGWWVEGHVEGVTGWSIGDAWEQESMPTREAASLYNKLEYLIMPTFYDRPSVYGQIMRTAIALNGSFFNAQRMVSQYMENAYVPSV
jgi:starch phosphorylase